jgi:hypothetical protein
MEKPPFAISFSTWDRRPGGSRIDAMTCIAGDHVNFARAFDHRVLANRNRQPRLLDPSPRIGRDRRYAGHVALLFDGRRNAGDIAIEQTREQRIARRCFRCDWRRHFLLPLSL